jgi:hypothetical protein
VLLHLHNYHCGSCAVVAGGVLLYCCLPSDNIKQALANFHLVLNNNTDCFKGSLMLEVTIITKASMPPSVSKTLKVLETSVERFMTGTGTPFEFLELESPFGLAQTLERLL